MVYERKQWNNACNREKKMDTTLHLDSEQLRT